MFKKVNIVPYDGLESLYELSPWAKEVLKLPNLPGIVVCSELRNQLDVLNCAKEIQRLISISSVSFNDTASIISAKTVWSESKISLRRLGHFKSIQEKERLGDFVWVSDRFCTIGQRTISYFFGKYSHFSIAANFDFMLQHPSVMIFNDPLPELVYEWLDNEETTIWVCKNPNSEISVNIDRIALTYPKRPISGIAVFGSEDFGGISCFCFGDRFKNRKIEEIYQ